MVYVSSVWCYSQREQLEVREAGLLRYQGLNLRMKKPSHCMHFAYSNAQHARARQFTLIRLRCIVKVWSCKRNVDCKAFTLSQWERHARPVGMIQESWLSFVYERETIEPLVISLSVAHL